MASTIMKEESRPAVEEKASGPRRRRRMGRDARAWKLALTSLVLASASYSNLECTAFMPPQHQQQRPLIHEKLLSRQDSALHMASSMAQQAQQPRGQGLSPYFQAILSRTNERQRFVTGKYPVIVTIEESPTQKWLNLGRSEGTATSVVLVNNTQIEKSLASYSRFQWLDDNERPQECYVSMELLAEIHIQKPGYLHIMPGDGAGSSAAALREASYTTRWNGKSRSAALYEQLEDLKWKGPYRDRLWVSGFTLAGFKGIVKSMDVHSGHINSVNARSASMALWPNEIHSVPANLLRPVGNNGQAQNTQSSSRQPMDDALLVSDGFLVPGKDRGGIYIVKKPGNPSEWTICLTERSVDNRWFYHRAMWIDLTGDGRQSILTARAKLRKVKVDEKSEVDSRPKNGQLVWLEMPKPHGYDESTGTPLEDDGTPFDPFSNRHLPWKERVLATGPDVMFNVADMDDTDDTIEVIASQFFDKKVTLHSIKKGPKPRVCFSRVIDDRCGAAFGGTFADLDNNNNILQDDDRHCRVIETGGSAGTVKPGESFSHLLVTSHECNYVAVEADAAVETDAGTTNGISSSSSSMNGKSIAIDGGSLFSYRVPSGKNGWKTKEWVRTTVASGFKVKGQLWNVINPGAPGFVYTFHAHKDDKNSGKRPLIAVAGDCAESAFVFRPDDDAAKDGADQQEHSHLDPQAKYRLMCEIKCGATVGSIGIGYEDLCSAEQEPGYVKLYVPCYEKDKILVFALGSGEDESEYVDDDGW